MKSVQMFVYSYFIMKGPMKDNSNMIIKCYPANKKMETLKYLSETKQIEIKEQTKFVSLTEQVGVEANIQDDYGSDIINRL